MTPTGQRPWPVTRANPRPQLHDAEAMDRAKAAADGMIDESANRLIAAATEKLHDRLAAAENDHAAAMVRISDRYRDQMRRQMIKARLLEVLVFLAGGGVGYALFKLGG